ncbi:vomeronasal 1 receptor 229 [Mus musculus]|jgi:vomeronasal1 receptor|uniref:Vomeronasal type-1 receptor n=2 Tax=Mus musculus TaxID=10090 RepID=Q8R2A9_MOUSE|nr:vomeronasal 1 receptor 229 [Mus musculus]AEF00188.1 vomeronasal type 1 receptor E1 [Mus musculus domesticus]AAL47906.1 vomeronasal receptor V1RE1 [Mus musculus]AEF00189.1 vomeronasal type 1 receptor E1 [Mus musculus domesticus]AEF00190.1 vomeronasal type 1 receptor E1 [Mus musculus domesticus]AEF00192.1 vomeronasal type 1 receptor E1 [Mus musculus domesticus]|eukprot:NP_598951.1 vomeronasal 1 receptor 229 [Mus musculus]
MDFGNLAMGIVLSLQSALGILGNFSLLFYYLVLYNKERTLKIIDIILIHVFTSNSLIIFSKGLPEVLAVFGWNDLFDDVGCKLIMYVRRVSRSMSISMTCLLSVFQAITISTRNSCWKEFKEQTAKFMGLFISLCWILFMLVNMLFPVYTSTNRNSKNKTQKKDIEFCHSVGRDKMVDIMYTAFCVFPEVLFSLLIVSSSTTMIVILYGHKKRVQHILHTHASPRTSAENRATQTILILVCTFLAFYTLSSVLQGYVALSHDPSWWVMNITTIISMGFPAIGPFVMSRDFTVSRFCFTCIGNLKLP